MVKIVILDDEKHCTDILQSLIQKINRDYKIVGVFNDPYVAMDFIKNNDLDLLFLDIQMPGLNGFGLLDKILPVDFDIIFTTAYDHYAIRAFEYSAINYLLKPITERNLVRALLSWEQRRQKVDLEQWKMLKGVVTHPEEEISKIALPTGTGYEIMKLNDIIHCQSDNNYTFFFLQDGSKVIICRTLKEVDEILSPHGFFRVHQSHLINAKYVKTISKQDGGMVILSNRSEIPVSRQKKEQINQLLESMLRFD